MILYLLECIFFIAKYLLEDKYIDII